MIILLEILSFFTFFLLLFIYFSRSISFVGMFSYNTPHTRLLNFSISAIFSSSFLFIIYRMFGSMYSFYLTLIKFFLDFIVNAGLENPPLVLITFYLLYSLILLLFVRRFVNVDNIGKIFLLTLSTFFIFYTFVIIIFGYILFEKFIYIVFLLTYNAYSYEYFLKLARFLKYILSFEFLIKNFPNLIFFVFSAITIFYSIRFYKREFIISLLISSLFFLLLFILMLFLNFLKFLSEDTLSFLCVYFLSFFVMVTLIYTYIKREGR